MSVGVLEPESAVLDGKKEWLSEPPRHAVESELPEWYLDFQKKSWEEFKQTPVPGRTNENWRFANLKQLRFDALNPVRSVTKEGQVELIERAKTNRVETFSAHFVFANNELIHSEINDLPENAICMPLNEALEKHSELVREHFMQEEKSLGGDKFKSLHGAATLSGIFVHVSKGSVIENPILVHHYCGGELTPVYPHSLIVSEDNASVSVMESYESIAKDDPGMSIGVVDLDASAGAKIQYISWQDAHDHGARHIHMNNTRVGRDSTVKSVLLNMGAAWVRNESLNRMIESGADSQIYSACLATDEQEYDQRTLQCHEAEHTTSDLLFKNALYDNARTVFGGLIQVLPGAFHTDSYQTCRNLLGSDTAEANSMPGLEIDADQVRCSHGSTSGRISDEEIFYLRARGIPSEDARLMISFGFLNEVIQKIDGDEIKELLADRVSRKFAEQL